MQPTLLGWRFAKRLMLVVSRSDQEKSPAFIKTVIYWEI